MQEAGPEVQEASLLAALADLVAVAGRHPAAQSQAWEGSHTSEGSRKEAAGRLPMPLGPKVNNHTVPFPDFGFENPTFQVVVAACLQEGGSPMAAHIQKVVEVMLQQLTDAAQPRVPSQKTDQLFQLCSSCREPCWALPVVAPLFEGDSPPSSPG